MHACIHTVLILDKPLRWIRTDQMSNQMDGYFNLVYTHELTKERVNGWLPDLVYSHELTKETVNGWEPAPANADACCTVLIAA